jgi:hypothetical protein
MPSPYAGLTDNVTLTFEVASQAIEADELGNVRSKMQPIQVRAVLKKSNRAASPPTQDKEDIATNAWFVEGFCVEPMILPLSISPNTWAKAEMTDFSGWFYLSAPINPPHGRGGIGAIYEAAQGTAITGWLQFSRSANP